MEVTPESVNQLRIEIDQLAGVLEGEEVNLNSLHQIAYQVESMGSSLDTELEPDLAASLEEMLGPLRRLEKVLDRRAGDLPDLAERLLEHSSRILSTDSAIEYLLSLKR